MSDIDSSSDIESDSDAELQEAFEKGLLKPGLNSVAVVENRKRANNVAELKRKLQELELKLHWIERLDMINGQAPLAPELAYKLQEEEEKMQIGKSKKNSAADDPVLNDFQRETMFHRQAQAAVLTGIPRIKELGIKTKRPEDYFAQMAKTDEHMQKVREALMKKQAIQERSEHVRKQRQLRKIGKQVQIQAKLKQASEKRELMEEVKKYRKGLRTDLDFLEDKKKQKPQPKQGAAQGNKRVNAKQKYKNTKFGFGGKKRGLKRNTKNSTDDISEYKKPGKPKRPGMPNKKQRPGNKKQRPGKNKRIKMKGKQKH